MRSQRIGSARGAAACCRGGLALALGLTYGCLARTDAPLGAYAYQPCAIDTASPPLPRSSTTGAKKLITRDERAFTPHPRAFVEALVLAAEPERIAVDHARYERAACEMERMQALVPALEGAIDHTRDDIGSALEVRFTNGDPLTSLGERRCLQSALDATSKLTPLHSSADVTFSGLYNLAPIVARYEAIDGVKGVTMLPRHFGVGANNIKLGWLASGAPPPPRATEATLSFHGDVMRWEFRTDEESALRVRVFETDPDGTITCLPVINGPR